MNLFRPEAIDEKRRRLWGEVRLAQPVSLAVWTAVLTFICVAVFVVLVFGKYTRKETVPGFLEGAEGMVEVRPVQAGRVSRILVQEGDTVSKGDPLIEFTSDISGIGGGPILDRQLVETDRQMTSLRDRQSAISQSYQGGRDRMVEQMEAQRRLKGILTNQLQLQMAALALAQTDAERTSRLQEKGFAPNAEVERRRRALLAEQAAVADMNSRISQVDASIGELASQLATLPAAEAAALATLEMEGARLAQRKAEIEVARGHVVHSPIDGTVSRLQVRAGATPSGQESLLAIVPRGSMLQARLLVPTRAIGFLNLRQEARLQVDAFPFQRFGFVTGYIRAIHPVVVRPGDAAFPIEHTEPVYEVEVFITREHMNAYGQRRDLRPGMTLLADIPIDRRTLWQQLFDPLLAAGKRAQG